MAETEWNPGIVVHRPKIFTIWLFQKMCADPRSSQCVLLTFESRFVSRSLSTVDNRVSVILVLIMCTYLDQDVKYISYCGK